MKFGLEENIIEKITRVLEDQPKVDKAYIFGSRAKGNYRPDSDIDIALKGYDLTVEDILKTGAAIDKSGIGHELDLVDYDSITEPKLLEHIDRVGTTFYKRWQDYKLNEVGTLQRGKSRHRPRYAFHLYGGNYPFIQTGDITEASKYITSYKQTYSEAGLAQSRLWKKGTLCITIAANIAEVAILDIDACFPDSIIGFIPDKQKSDLDYVFYTLIYYQRQLQQMGDGSVQDNINLGTFEQIKFPFPPLKEQQIIADTLSSLDYKIDLLHRQNKTLESMAEALFKHWFVEKGEDDWEEKSLTEIARYLNGLALQNFPAKGNEYLPVIKIRELKQGNTENSDICDANIPLDYIVKNGDVLFSWSGSLEIVLWAGKTGALNQHLFKITSQEYPKWLYYLATKYHLAYFKAVAESKSTTMGHIQRHHLEGAKISIPPQPLLEKLNAIFEPLIIKEVKNNEQILSLLDLRDALLPKLLSGEARVKIS